MVDDLIDKVLEYLLWLQEPNDSFGGMPVCPFVKKDFESNDIEYIMYGPDMEFIEVIDKYVESGKRTGLIIQIGINKPYKVRNGRKKYQTYLNKVIAEKYPKSEDQPKVLVFDPNEEWTAGGGIETRKMAPTVLINIARRGDLSKAHKKLEGSRWWSSFTKKELKALHGNPTIYNKENDNGISDTQTSKRDND